MAELPPHLQHIADFRQDINERLTLLRAHVNGKPFESLPAHDQALILYQESLMKSLSGVLAKRLSRGSSVAL